jgi:ABC-type lipoprotein release transport system permease subunit
MLQCVGAQSKDVRRAFASGGLFLAFRGWILGLPLGYAVCQIIAVAMASGMKLTLPDKYGLIYVGWSFAFTMVGTLIVIFFPIPRATTMKPGDPIRYE